MLAGSSPPIGLDPGREGPPVTFVETFEMTETLFEAALDARNRGCDENAEEIARMLLSWTFKGGPVHHRLQRAREGVVWMLGTCLDGR